MRLTRRGWSLAGVVAMAAAAGRTFGLRELLVAAAAGTTILVLALVSVGTQRARLTFVREARPRRVPAGGTCRVEVAVTNSGRRTTGSLALIDPISNGVEARLQLAPLRRGVTREMRYRLPVERRGVLNIGPLAIEVTDPFGLALRRSVSSSQVAVVVLPRVVPLAGLPASVGDEPDSNSWRRRHLATATEEFTALRDYVAGDDIRRIHWPATARRGAPIVRQMEEPWQRRCTVVLDTRSGHYRQDGFERAVSAAASVIDAAIARGELVRLLTTTGRDTGFIGDIHALDAALDLLAGLRTAEGSITGTTRQLVLRSGGGALVSIVGRLPPSERALVGSVGAGFNLHVVVQCEPGEATLAAGPATTAVAFHVDGQLTSTWDAAVQQLTVEMSSTSAR